MVLCPGGPNFAVEEIGEEISRPSDLFRSGRAFIMRDVTFAEFKKALEKMFGPGASAVLYYVGLGCGRRSCMRLISAQGQNRIFEALARLKEEEG